MPCCQSGGPRRASPGGLQLARLIHLPAHRTLARTAGFPGPSCPKPLHPVCPCAHCPGTTGGLALSGTWKEDSISAHVRYGHLQKSEVAPSGRACPTYNLSNLCLPMMRDYSTLCCKLQSSHRCQRASFEDSSWQLEPSHKRFDPTQS